MHNGYAAGCGQKPESQEDSGSSELHLLALAEGLVLNDKKTNSPGINRTVLTQRHLTHKWQVSGYS